MFGQPADTVVGILLWVLVAVGAFLLIWGLIHVMRKKGQIQLGAGVAVLILALIFVGMFPIQLPSASVGVTPPAGGSWQVCLTNANYATVGLGTCPTSMVAAKAVTKSQTAPTSNFYVYFNITVTPPSGSNQIAYNGIVQTGSVPSLTNTSNPTETAPVLALRGGGQYDVLITPASGTGTYQQQVVPFTSGTAKVIAFQVHFSTIIGELGLTQYPVGVNVSFTVTDQNTGALYGTITASVTFT